jgi:hypothetical protein
MDIRSEGNAGRMASKILDVKSGAYMSLKQPMRISHNAAASRNFLGSRLRHFQSCHMYLTLA